MNTNNRPALQLKAHIDALRDRYDDPVNPAEQELVEKIQADARRYLADMRRQLETRVWRPVGLHLLDDEIERATR